MWAEPSDCIYGLVFHVEESLGILSLDIFQAGARKISDIFQAIVLTSACVLNENMMQKPEVFILHTWSSNDLYVFKVKLLIPQKKGLNIN